MRSIYDEEPSEGGLSSTVIPEVVGFKIADSVVEEGTRFFASISVNSAFFSAIAFSTL